MTTNTNAKPDLLDRAMDKKMAALEVLLAVAAKVQAHRAFVGALPDGEAEDCADNHGQTTFDWEIELAEAAGAYAEATWDCAEACEKTEDPLLSIVAPSGSMN